MLRRQARVRREFLFKKNVEQKEAATFERKRKVKEAIDSGQKIPAELRTDADRLRHEASLDDAEHQAGSSIDSEYANAGSTTPKFL